MGILYGVLRGTVEQFLHHAPDEAAPHIEVLVTAASDAWRIAVNVRSDDQTNLIYRVERNFAHPVLQAAAALPRGLTRPDRDRRSLRLDYVRGNMFDAASMRSVDATAVGDPNALDDLISAELTGIMTMPGGEIFAFGNPWGPEPDKPDKYFGYLPGRGIHDIHMNQGSPAAHARDDGVWQDGALILQPPGGTATALFFAFQNQTWDTDDTTGRARPKDVAAPAT